MCRRIFIDTKKKKLEILREWTLNLGKEQEWHGSQTRFAKFERTWCLSLRHQVLSRECEGMLDIVPDHLGLSEAS